MAELHPAAIAVVAALLGGVAGGALVRVTTKTTVAAASASREPGTAAADTGDLAKRVAQLEQNASRTERSRRVERAALAAAPGDEPAAAPGSGRPSVDDPVFETAVRDILDRANDERREERDARQVERRRRMAEAWTQDMTTELGLSDAQKQKVAKIVQEYFESLRAMRDSDAGAGSPGEWRERARTEREKAEAKLAQALDAGQMEKYKGLDQDKKLGAGGGGRRRQRD